MAQQNSFDIVSEVNMQEVDNALNQAQKEVAQRYDLKDSKSTIDFDQKEKTVTVSSLNEFTLKSVVDVLQNKFIKRGIHLKSLKYGPVEQAAGGTSRQKITLQVGIDKENAKTLVKIDQRLKAQGAGANHGRTDTGFGQRPRRASGRHRKIEGARFSPSTSIHQLPVMNKNTLRHVLLCVVGFFPVLNGSLLFAQQQDSSEIFVVKNPAASKYVSAITINGMRYVSLPDLVRMFGLNYFYNPATKKMEIKLSRAEIKLAAENSFVIVTDYATRKQTPLQVPVPTHAVGDTLYAPLLYFLPIFNSISRTELAVDTAREMSLSGFDSTGELKHFDISSVTVESRKNGYLIRIHSSVKIHDADRFIRNDDWLYVTLPNVRADTAALNADTLNPIIEQMLAVQSPTSVQISFKLRKKISTSEIVQDEASNDLLVSIQTVSPPSKKELAAERKRREEEANQEAEHRLVNNRMTFKRSSIRSGKNGNLTSSCSTRDTGVTTPERSGPSGHVKKMLHLASS